MNHCTPVKHLRDHKTGRYLGTVCIHCGQIRTPSGNVSRADRFIDERQGPVRSVPSKKHKLRVHAARQYLKPRTRKKLLRKAEVKAAGRSWS